MVWIGGKAFLEIFLWNCSGTGLCDPAAECYDCTGICRSTAAVCVRINRIAGSRRRRFAGSTAFIFCICIETGMGHATDNSRTFLPCPVYRTDQFRADGKYDVRSRYGCGNGILLYVIDNRKSWAVHRWILRWQNRALRKRSLQNCRQ